MIGGVTYEEVLIVYIFNRFILGVRVVFGFIVVFNFKRLDLIIFLVGLK